MNIYQQEQPVFVGSDQSPHQSYRIADMLLTWYASDKDSNPVTTLNPGETRLYSVIPNPETSGVYDLTFIGRHPTKNVYYRKVVPYVGEDAGHLRYTTGDYTYIVTDVHFEPIDGQTGVWWYHSGGLVSSGMTVVGGVLSRGDVYDIYRNGVGSSTTLRNYGSLTVHSGGTAADLHTFGGDCRISSGGSAVRAIFGGGVVLRNGVINSAQATGAVLASAGAISNITISGGTNAQLVAYNDFSVILVVSGATVLGNGAKIQARASAVMTDVSVSSGGIVWVWLGAKVNSTTVSDGGFVAVSANGEASNVTVFSGASLTVSSGGTALAVTSNTGAVVSVYEGGYIEYV